MALSALTEGFSQMSGAACNLLSDKTGMSVRPGELDGRMVEDPGQLDVPPGEFLRIRYDFTADGSSAFLEELFDISVAKALAARLMPAGAGAGAGGGGGGGGGGLAGLFGGGQSGGGGGGGQFQAGFQQQPPVFSTGGGGQVGVQPVQFSPLSGAEQSGVSGNIGLLMDVSMQLTVELGRTKMLIKDILGMGEGTIVELDKLAGEPVDLLVNGKLIAKGEVVVIDENFGVRVTDIISPMERISNME
jgi:flagellar motor switch protein FliN/FliY